MNLKLSLPFLFCFLLFFQLTFAQKETHEYQDYDWEKNRKRNEIPVHLEEDGSVVFLDKNIIEYLYISDTQELFIYKTYHIIRWLGSTDAVERYNKIYIPLGEGSLESFKVRSISPSGEVVVSDKNNAKEINDEESGRGYKIFAIEGVEKGSEIEYFYTTKELYEEYLQEGRQFLQTGTHTKNVLFELITPSFLAFDAKEYNDLPEIELIEDEDKEKRFHRLEMDSVVAMEGAPFAYSDPNRMRVDYKFAYNLSSNARKRVRTWEDAARQLFSIYCQTYNKQEEKALKKLYKEAKIKGTEEDKIRQIETYIKTKIQTEESPAPMFSIISEIEKTKIANERGQVRLFTNMLDMAEVSYELVMTCDRSDIKFDGDFDYWKNMREFLIYFPNTKKYLAPAATLYRYGIVPDTWTATDGLFVRKIQIGEAASGIGTIRTIQPLEGDKNFSNINLKMTFSEEMEAVKADLVYSFGGLSAVPIQAILPYLPKDKADEQIESILKGLAKDAEFEKIELKNEEINTDLLKEEFAISANFETESWIEKAGNKYLFNIGKCIGPQSELYQEKERKLAVENGHNRIYKRTLVFEVPQEYKVKNLEDLKINVVFDKDNKKNCGFISEYKQKGNEVIVDIFEYYYEIYLPLEDFEEYRKVINAAADFNKIVLVLEKS